MTKEKDKNNLKIIEQVTKELFKLLDVEVKIKLTEDKENEAVKVQIDTKSAELLIGYQGRTLNSLQLVLGLMVSKKLDNWQRVVVNVGDYREQREQELKELAMSTAQKVKFSGQPAFLSNLSSFERRLVHLFLVDHPDVVTESEGEENYRRLVVKPKSK